MENSAFDFIKEGRVWYDIIKDGKIIDNSEDKLTAFEIAKDCEAEFVAKIVDFEVVQVFDEDDF